MPISSTNRAVPASSLPPDSLGAALLGAARAVTLVQGGSALPQALAAVFARREPSAQTRGAVQDIAYRAMRGWGRSTILLGLLASRPPEPPLLASLLACSLALLDDARHAGYEEFTIVDQSVAAAAAERETAPAKGMVNAVLRRFLREREPLMRKALSDPQAQWNFPGWWVDATRTAYPDRWQSILEVGNSVPPLTLRVNRRRGSTDDYLALLEREGVGAARIGPDAVRLAKPMPVGKIPGFDDGMVSVQDAAAQLAAPLMDLQDGMRVLDACAAPGGKTGHLLECADLDLLALDQDPARLARVADNLSRLRLQATLREGDARRADWWDDKPFDRILADVPCTASGIVRRHPDIRWLRRPDDAAKLATLSRGILDNLWQMLRPGGKFLLVTCSLWPIESEGQAAEFAERHGAIRLPAPGQLLPAAGPEDDHDGLFYALFQKGRD